VRIRIPKARQVKSIHFLVGQSAPRTRVNNGFVEVEVPPFELHEAIAIDLA
jgi:hypothetical protein